jgi:hypothetical protein
VVSPEAAPDCSVTHSIHRYNYLIPILDDTNTFVENGQLRYTEIFKNFDRKEGG